jgi:hypothetical protein
MTGISPFVGKTLDDLIEQLQDVADEFGSGQEVVQVQDRSGEIIGYVSGIDVGPDGQPWIDIEFTEGASA